MLYQVTVPQYKKMLGVLSHLLDRAQGHFKELNVSDEALLNFRLAPDMFPLSKQIFITCDTVKFLVSDLAGKETTGNTYSEKTLEDFKGRIQDALKALDSLSPGDLEGKEEKLVTQQWWGGKSLKGYDYVIEHSIPTFYFHVTTAYDILRHNGLQIGKKDFLGSLPFKC